MLNLTSLIILDRDGVINKDSKKYIKSSNEFKVLPGSLNAIKTLNKKRIPIAIATNQSGIGRKFFSYSTVYSIHQKLFNLLGNNRNAIRYIAICPHIPEQQCNFRKPKIGMLREISHKLMIPINKQVFVIGDKFKDIEAAKTANCTPVLINTEKKDLTKTLKYYFLKKKILVFQNLQQFVVSII